MNNSLYDIQGWENSNNRRNSLKTMLTIIISTTIISFFILYSIKYDKHEIDLSNENYHIINSNMKDKVNLHNLEENDSKLSTENININKASTNSVEDEMKKYLNLLLEHLGSEFKFIFGKPFVMSKEAYYLEKEKQIFLSKLMQNTYNGTWEYFPYVPNEEDKRKNISTKFLTYYINSSNKKFKIGDYKNGTVHFNFKKAIEMSSKLEALAISMKNLEGNYIDNWIHHVSYAKLNDLIKIIDNKNKLYILKGEYSTSLIKGKLFNTRKSSNKKMQCNTLIEMEFPLIYVTLQSTLNNKTVQLKNISSINPSNFNILLSSTCGFRIKIKAQIYNSEKEYYTLKQKINYFSNYCLIGSILYLIGIVCLTNSLKNNESAVSAICIESYSQNVAWNLYCAMSNLNFGLVYYEYFLNFSILAIFSLVNFVIFDLRFLYFFWKIKKRVTSDREFIKLKLKFFALFYSLLFISFFSILSFYTNRVYIILLSITLWTPQIIHNMVYNNKYILPMFFIFSSSLIRMIYPFYFRGYENNFTYLKCEKNIILISFGYILFSIIFLYLQGFLGPRFLLPSKYQKKKADFYRTKEELLKEKPDSIKEECVICLTQIFDEEENNNNNDIIINVDLNKKENESSSDFCSESKNESINSNGSQQNSRIDLMNSQIKQQDISINNNLENINNINVKIKQIYKYNKMNKNNGSLAINAKHNENKKNNKNNRCRAFRNIMKILKVIFCENVFFFYKIKTNLGEKKYMLICCGHVFHSTCLEKWFDRKKECPSCRKSMEEYL